jgi:hypothetical protein
LQNVGNFIGAIRRKPEKPNLSVKSIKWHAPCDPTNYPMKSSYTPRVHSRAGRPGKIGWILLWVIGIPVPVLAVLFSSAAARDRTLRHPPTSSDLQQSSTQKLHHSTGASGSWQFQENDFHLPNRWQAFHRLF